MLHIFIKMEKQYNVKEEVESVKSSYSLPETLSRFAFWSNTKANKDQLENMAQNCLICGIDGGDCFDFV